MREQKVTDKDQSGNAGSPFSRTAQHDAKRAAILSQASRLFNLRGSRSTTLLDIAGSLGLTKTSLYYYVKTKEELIYQCYLSALDKQMRGLDQIEKRQRSGLERLQAVYRDHFFDCREALEGRRTHRAALLEIASLKGRRRHQVEQQYIQLFLRIRRFVQEGIAEGSIRPVESSAVTLCLIGSLQWTFNWLRTVPPERIDAVSEAACDLLVNGLTPQPAQYRFGDFDFSALYSSSGLQGFDRKSQNQMKQDAFYKTATRFFNEKGFAGASLDEIAETLEVTKGAFYYHIKNKEDLLYHCYQRSLDMARRQYDAAQACPSGLERLDYVCRAAFHVQNSFDGPMIRYNSITALPIPRRRKIVEATAALSNRFGQTLRDGIEDGSVRKVDVETTQELISSAINASMDLPMWRKMEDLDQASRDYYDCFFNGLKPR